MRRRRTHGRAGLAPGRSLLVLGFGLSFGCCLLLSKPTLGDAGELESCQQRKSALDADWSLELDSNSEQRADLGGVSLLQGRAADRRFRKTEASPNSALSATATPGVGAPQKVGRTTLSRRPSSKAYSAWTSSAATLLQQGSDLRDPPAPEVEVACGTIHGSQARKNVAAYWGIPFGEAPRGKLRFKPPQAAKCWKGKLDATKSRASCLPAPMPPLIVPGNFSEDCLHLDVFAPTVNGSLHKPKSLPVLVNIFGGSLVTGCSTCVGPLQAFVDRSIRDEEPFVMMAMNYRLGPLGFAAIDELAKADPRGVAGNYGILDQILSLEWLRDNIAAFGGDPERVTLMGQSSGGTSIFALLASPGARGLFKSVMSFSGSPQLSTPRDVKEDVDRRLWLPGTGCGKLTGEDLLDCLMKASPEALQNALPESYQAYGFEMSLPSRDKDSLGWSPLVYVDGVTIPASIKQALVGGSARDVNVMFTSMQCENDPPAGGEALVQTALEGFLPAGKSGSQDAQNLMLSYQQQAGLYTTEENRAAYAVGALVADSSVTCGNVYLALSAHRGGSKNVFIGTVVQGPSNKVLDMTCSGEVHDGQLPFHGFDFQSVLTWANDQAVWIPDGWCPYEPDRKDLALASELWKNWLSFIQTGRPLAAWHEIGDLGFSTKNLYAHGVLGADGQGGITTELDWKLDQCMALHDMGVGQTYWWMN